MTIPLTFIFDLVGEYLQIQDEPDANETIEDDDSDTETVKTDDTAATDDTTASTDSLFENIKFKEKHNKMMLLTTLFLLLGFLFFCFGQSAVSSTDYQVCKQKIINLSTWIYA